MREVSKNRLTFWLKSLIVLAALLSCDARSSMALFPMLSLLKFTSASTSEFTWVFSVSSVPFPSSIAEGASNTECSVDSMKRQSIKYF